MTILTDNHPILRKHSSAVGKIDVETKNLIEQLTRMARGAHDPEGVGLAAPQIGVTKRIFIALLGGHWVPFINPTIIWRQDEQDIALEGCLSFPGLYGEVRRPISIEIRTTNKHGRSTRRRYTKLSARIIQHEIDHLDGILFLDHVRKQGGRLFRSTGKDEKGKEILREVSLEEITSTKHQISRSEFAAQTANKSQ